MIDYSSIFSDTFLSPAASYYQYSTMTSCNWTYIIIDIY